ncbi:MAG: SBBP repeat-containing protein, partial [Terriglobales bacterium]
TLLYSTYLGGHARDWGNAITQDSGGNIYVTGVAFSRDFPTLSTLSAPPVTLFASRDSGTSWVAASGSTSFQVTAFAVDRNTPGTVYAGQVGSGVIKSTDFGATWTATTATQSYSNALVLDPTTTGTNAVLYEGSRFNGVRKITGGGTANTFINSGLTSFNVLSLVLDPASNATLYAGLNGSGVWVTTSANGPTPTWTKVTTTGLGDQTIYALAFDPATHALYAGTNNGVYRLASGATSWTTVAGGPTGLAVLALSIDSSSNVYAASFGGGLFKLSAGAWSTLNGSGGTALGTLNLRAVAVDPATPSTIYAAGRSRLGIYKSTDGGSTWSLLNSGLTITSVQALAIDPASTGNVYAGMINLMSFVAKFNSEGSPTVLAFFGGGSGSTQPYTIAVDDPTSNMYIGGSTSTASLPTPLVGQTTIGGNTDGFVAKISTGATPAVVWDRYLGGAFDDIVYSLALDQNLNVDVTGYTTSADFPVSAGAYQSALKVTPNFAANAFVSEIDPTGATLLYSTYFGGTGGDDEGTGVAVVSTSSIASITVTNGGSGYTSGPTVTISGGGGSGATTLVSINTITHQVTGIDVINPGSGYIFAPSVTLSGGGAVVNATAQAVLSSPLT